MDGLPTPPNEEHTSRPHGLKRAHPTTKPVKTVHRSLKRTNTNAHPPSPARDSHSQHSGDGRHKRVWKACERCRMKKTKCDGEFPCKRCKDDGLICTAGTRKKTEYKQLPPGYAEVLENTQFVLVATVQKLYSMVRNGDAWDLGEPELNDRGLPIIHNVAAKLGCLRPNSDLDLPIQSIFPEDEAGLAELARQLQEQQRTESQSGSGKEAAAAASSRTDRASSSDLEHSDDLDFDDYRKAAFGSASALSMSPASLSYGGDFEPADGFPPPPPTTSTTSQQSPTIATHPASNSTFQWAAAAAQLNCRPTSMDFATPTLWMQDPSLMGGAGLMGMGYDLKQQQQQQPQVFSSSCRNPEIMMGMGDPTMYSAFDEDPTILRQAF